MVLRFGTVHRTLALIVLFGFAITSTIPVGAGPAGSTLRIGIDVDAGTLDPLAHGCFTGPGKRSTARPSA